MEDEQHTDWAREDEDTRAAKQEGDVHALDVEGDPRGGVQSDAYRHADPRDLVIEGETAMSGPGGTPQRAEPPTAHDDDEPDAAA